MQPDATGKKYVYQALDELDKNHRGKDQPDDSPGEGRMYERPNSPYCPVKTFELFCRVCGKGRRRVKVLAKVMKFGIVMLLSEKIR